MCTWALGIWWRNVRMMITRRDILIVLFVIVGGCSNSRLASPVQQSPHKVPLSAGETRRVVNSAADSTRQEPSRPTKIQPQEATSSSTPTEAKFRPSGELRPVQLGIDDCGQLVSGNLPGASIRITTNRCAYSLSELSAGVSITYEIRFEEALRAVRPYQLRDPVVVPWPRWGLNFKDACFRPGDASNIFVAYWIASSGTYLKDLRLWCPDCEGPRCPPIVTAARDIQPSVYSQVTVRWSGNDQLHPGLLPPGDYELTLRADGTFVPDGENAPQPFHMQTTRRVTITP